MLLAIAALLIHPQLRAAVALPAEKTPIDASVSIAGLNPAGNAENSLPSLTASWHPLTQPEAELKATLPDPPVRLTAPAPIAFLRPLKPVTVSVAELRAENRRKQLMWRGLIIATSGAATFDAWSTRHAITTTGAIELNPMLKPFAGNGSLYAAIQVGPALLDLAGKKMMYSRYRWVRRMWWVPQSASFVSSMFCGAHNLAYH